MGDPRRPFAAAALLAAGVLVASAAPATGAAPAPAGGEGAPPLRADTSHADTTPAAAEAEGATTPDTSIVYRREVFEYPTDGLRNPFRPINAGGQRGPRLEDLTLSGIIYSPESGSVAVLVNPNTQRRYQLRVGDRIGGARVVEITKSRAVFRVDAFGFDRRTVLRLQRDEESSQ